MGVRLVVNGKVYEDIGDGKGGEGVTDHTLLTGRDELDQHPMEAITDLVPTIEEIQKSITLINLAINNITDTVNNIQQSINDINKTINDINKSIGDINKTINDVKNTVNGLTQSVNSIINSINSINQTINDLKKQIESLNNANKDIDNKINALPNQFVDTTTVDLTHVIASRTLKADVKISTQKNSEGFANAIVVHNDGIYTPDYRSLITNVPKTYTDTSTVDLDYNTSSQVLKANVKVSTQKNSEGFENLITINSDGLYVPNYRSLIQNLPKSYTDTATIDLDYSTAKLELKANVKISTVSNNAISAKSDGIYAANYWSSIAAMPNSFIDTPSISFSHDVSARTLRANAKRVQSTENALEIRTAGLFVDKYLDVDIEDTKSVHLYFEGKGETLREMFDNGNVFSYNGTNTKIAKPGEANAWYFDSSLDSFVQPKNTDTFTGFVSNIKYRTYTHRCTLRSKDADNDIDGLIVAYYEDVDGNPHNISFMVARGTNVSGFHYAFAKDYGLPGQQILYQKGNTAMGNSAPSAPSGGNAGWKGHYITLEVQKQGTIISCAASDWDSDEINYATTISIDLTEYSWGEHFAGKVQYGYCNKSQADSYFTDIYFKGKGPLKAEVIVSKDANNGLEIRNNGVYCYYNKSTGSSTSAKVDISSLSGNIITLKNDGLYASALTKISTDSGNIITQRSNGIYASGAANVEAENYTDNLTTVRASGTYRHVYTGISTQANNIVKKGNDGKVYVDGSPITTLQTTVNNISKQVNSLSSSIDSLTKNYESLNTKYDSLSKDQQNLNNKVSGLETGQANLDKKVNALEGNDKDLDSKDKELEKKDKELSDRIDALEKNGEQLGDIIEDIIKDRNLFNSELDYYYSCGDNNNQILGLNADGINVTDMLKHDKHTNMDDEEGYIILKKGRKYAVKICLGIDFDNGNNINGAMFKIIDENGNQYGSTGYTSPGHTDAYAEAMICPEADIRICVLAFNDIPNMVTLYPNYSWITIHEIGRISIVDSIADNEDTPVGHVMMITANNCPKHYIKCDGAVYNIIDYQILADYINSEFGSYDYFGGNGTDTFAVPDYSDLYISASYNDDVPAADTIMYVIKYEKTYAANLMSDIKISEEAGNIIKSRTDGIYVSKDDIRQIIIETVQSLNIN